MHVYIHLHKLYTNFDGAVGVRDHGECEAVLAVGDGVGCHPASGVVLPLHDHTVHALDGRQSDLFTSNLVRVYKN